MIHLVIHLHAATHFSILFFIPCLQLWFLFQKLTRPRILSAFVFVFCPENPWITNCSFCFLPFLLPFISEMNTHHKHPFTVTWPSLTKGRFHLSFVLILNPETDRLLLSPLRALKEKQWAPLHSLYRAATSFSEPPRSLTVRNCHRETRLPA